MFWRIFYFIVLLLTGLITIWGCNSGASEQKVPPAGNIQQGVKINAQKHRFTPEEFRLKIGVPATIVMTSIEGKHSLKIDELNVSSREVSKGETMVIEFTPEKTGRYQFYCGHGSHKDKGMIGTLIIGGE